jgi:hypothetical protein
MRGNALCVGYVAFRGPEQREGRTVTALPPRAFATPASPAQRPGYTGHGDLHNKAHVNSVRSHAVHLCRRTVIGTQHQLQCGPSSIRERVGRAGRKS